MSFMKGGSTFVLPLAFLKECVATYTREHGQAPKILVMNPDEYLESKLNLSLHQVKQLGLKVTYGDYLKRGEFDLAVGIKGRDLDDE